MSSSLEDGLFNFDLSLLQANPNSAEVESKNEKQRKALLILKRKIIFSNSAVEKILSNKSQYDEAINKYSILAEENKQVCIEYNNALDEVRKLEKNGEFYRRHIKELQEKLDVSDTQCKAVQSHANQLQQLVQESETKIESLKIENQLTKANTKEQNTQKQTSKSLKSDFDVFFHDFCLFRDIVVGKKHLQSHHKRILKKYEKFNPNTDAYDSTSDCSINDIEDILNDSNLSATLRVNQLFTARDAERTKHGELSNKNRDVDHDSDSYNEVVSEDTGRGSSIASSDIEKCFNSPDYSVPNSPFNIALIKDRKNYTDMSTSPITVQLERSNACTSPILFANKIHVCDTHKQTKDIGIQVRSNDLIAYRNVRTSPIKIRVHERATSPLRIVQQDRALSPIENNTVENVASPVPKPLQENKTVSPIKHVEQESSACPATLKSKTRHHPKKDKIECSSKTSANEKESLQINSNEVCADDDQESDGEVENILRSVRLEYNLITPIPKSPAKEQKNDIHPASIQQPQGYSCSDTAKLAQVVEKLRADIGALANYVFSKTPCVSDDNTRDTTNNCKGNEIITNSCEHDLAKPTESCEMFETSIDNSAMHPETVSSHKPQDIEVSFKIDKVQAEHLINNNKSEDRIVSQEYTIKSPTLVMDKIKKCKKLTRLERLRKKLLPKGKIRRALTPPIRKISRKNPLLFKKKIIGHSATLAQNNKIAYENAVKVMAEIRAKEKNKSVNSTPCKNKDTLNNIITQEVQIVLSKCDDPVVQSKNIASIAESGKAPPLDVSSVKQNTTVNSVSDIRDSSTKMYVSKAPINEDDSSIQSVIRRSKRLSSSVSNNSDISNRSVENAEELTINEIQSCKRHKSAASEMLESPHKKLLKLSKSSLRSKLDFLFNENANITPCNTISKPLEQKRRSSRLSITEKNESQTERDLTNHDTAGVVTYNDIHIFTEKIPQPQTCQNNSTEDNSHFKHNFLCKLITKHGRSSVKWNAKKLPEKVFNAMYEKIEDIVTKVETLSSNNAMEAMENFRQDLRKCNIKIFLGGLMKFLMDPTRKDEMFNKISHLNSPPMTKSERALLFILKELRYFWSDVDLIAVVLRNVQYTLFKLNHSPDFGKVESLSHFYAVLCRYVGRLAGLRMFVLDAMYCLQFKCVAVIKQCIEVWMHILPLAHMGMAKSPIVICLIYLLHFFKCEDKFNRVQEMRSILCRKYFYKIYDWSESDILEMLQNAITELSDEVMERKMLRMCLIIFAKRKGPQWCQKHIVNNMLLSLIRKPDVPDNVKEFCISVMGPLLKPYPSIMKFHCESVFNELLVMLEKAVTPTMKEAILSSLLVMRHNPERVHHMLFKWNPGNVSADFQQVLADYIREKPANVWKTIVEKIASDTDKYDDYVNL